MSDTHSLDWMAERLVLSATKTLQNLSEKVRAVKVLGTIASSFKREATAQCSSMRRKEPGKRTHTGTLLIFLTFFLLIHSFKVLITFDFIQIHLNQMLFLKLGDACIC